MREKDIPKTQTDIQSIRDEGLRFEPQVDPLERGLELMEVLQTMTEMNGDAQIFTDAKGCPQIITPQPKKPFVLEPGAIYITDPVDSKPLE